MTPDMPAMDEKGLALEKIIAQIKRFDRRGGLGLDVHDAMEDWIAVLSLVRASLQAVPEVEVVAWGLLQLGTVIEVTNDHMRREAWTRGGNKFVALVLATPQPAPDAAEALSTPQAGDMGAVKADIETLAWECSKWPAWLHNIVNRTNEVADRLDMSSEQAHAYAVLSALSSAPVGEMDGWQPTHKHVKRGSMYRLDGYGEIQTDTPLTEYAKVAIYRAEDGTTWVRPVGEFEDGRFEPVASPQGGR